MSDKGKEIDLEGILEDVRENDVGDRGLYVVILGEDGILYQAFHYIEGAYKREQLLYVLRSKKSKKVKVRIMRDNGGNYKIVSQYKFPT